MNYFRIDYVIVNKKCMYKGKIRTQKYAASHLICKFKIFLYIESLYVK